MTMIIIDLERFPSFRAVVFYDTMEKPVIDEDWYSFEPKQLRLMESILERQDKLMSKLESMETNMTTLLQRMDHLETSDKRHAKESAEITSHLRELKVLKEREINMLIREKIPFPFMMNKPQVLTPLSFSFRRPFTNSMAPKE